MYLHIYIHAPSKVDFTKLYFLLFFRILVGAPLGQNLQQGTNRSGALFKCPLSGYEEDCEQVVTDGKRGKAFENGAILVGTF